MDKLIGNVLIYGRSLTNKIIDNVAQGADALMCNQLGIIQISVGQTQGANYLPITAVLCCQSHSASTYSNNRQIHKHTDRLPYASTGQGKPMHTYAKTQHL